MTESELKSLMELSYGGELQYNRDETFVDMFLRHAEERGGKTAAADVDGKISYSDLALASKVVAHRLIELGVKPGDFVLVKMPRCKEYLIPVLGVARAGACWVPVDPEYPQDRIDYMISDCGAKVTIDVDWLLGLKKHYGLKALTLPKINLAKPDGLAYMLYTSGSTGRPKGVMLPHKALRAFIAWQIDRFKMEPGCRHAEHCSFCFDLSIMDLCGTIAAGGEVHVIHEEIRRDLDAVNDFLKERKIEGMVFGTQFGTELLNNCEVPLKFIVLCGEKLMPFRKQRPDLEVINMYGPTEFTIGCTEHVVDIDKDAANIPIGRPYQNTWNFIVDKDMNLLPRGEVGELCLAGAQMGVGYWNQPDKTAAAFVKCPFFGSDAEAKGLPTIMYRTGDLAKWGEDGELLCLGRLDHQVKIRGFRIELGEVENVAKTMAGVNLVAAAAKESRGTKHLVLYYTGEKADEAAFKAHLEKTLAYYMIPEVFVHLEAMPMTPNGKIDRKQLPEPDFGTGTEYVEPADGKEKTIAAAFAEVLSLPADVKVGANDGFFALGGESLKAIRLVSFLKKKGLVLSVADILAHNTVRELAKVEGKAADIAAVEAKSPLDDAPWSKEQRIAAQKHYAEQGLEIERAYPVTGLQEFMVMETEQPDGGIGFDEVLHFELDFVPPEKVMRAALDRLAIQHEVFRTAVFHENLDEPVQVILKGRKIALAYRDAPASEAAKITMEEIATPFNLVDDPLCRALVLRTGDGHSHLIITMFHVFFDGSSVPKFVSDFRRYLTYEMLPFWKKPFRRSLLPAKAKDGLFERFVRTIRAMDMAPAKEYWQHIAGDWDDKSVIPSTGSEADKKRNGDNKITVTFSKEVTAKIEQLCHAESATVNTCCELAWGRVLQSAMKKPDVLFVKVVARRSLAEEDAQDAVGMFMGAIAMRVTTEKGETVREALGKLQKQAAESSRWEYCSEYSLAEMGTRGMDSFQSIVSSADYGDETGGEIPGVISFRQIREFGYNVEGLEVRPYYDDNRQLAIGIIFNTTEFTREDIQKAADGLNRAMEGFAANPEAEFLSVPAYI